MTVLVVSLWVAAILGAVHLLFCWMENRGWIYYRRQGERPLGAAASNALLHFEAIVNPAAEHVIEELNRQEVGTVATGEPYSPDIPESDPDDV